MNKRSIAALALLGTALALPAYALGVSRADAQADLPRVDAAGLPANANSTHAVTTHHVVAVAPAGTTATPVELSVTGITGNAPRTRAEVRAELVAAEEAGRSQADDYHTYPAAGPLGHDALPNPVAQGGPANGMSYGLHGDVGAATY